MVNKTEDIDDIEMWRFSENYCHKKWKSGGVEGP